MEEYKFDEINNFIKELENKKIVLWTENGKIKYKAPKGVITVQELDKIKSQKEKIIQFLTLKQRTNEKLQETFPLTAIQRAYLLGSDEAYALGGINAHYYMELESTCFDTEQLSIAFNKVIKNTDALRTIILPEGKQAVLDKVPDFVIEEVYFQNEDERRQARERWSHCRYELQKWPLYNMRISHIEGQPDILHIDFDCIVMDAWSAKMMITKMFDLYGGQSVEWPAYSFKQYCMDEIEYRKTNLEKEAWSYWKEKVKSLPLAPMLPYRKKLALIHGHRFSRLSDKLTKEDTKLLYQLIKKNRLTPAAVICTVYMKILAAYSENSELTLNLTLFNRLPLHKDVQNILGDFTNIGVASFTDNLGSFLDEVRFVQKQFWDLIRFHSFNGTQILKLLSSKSFGQAVLPVVFTGVLQGERFVKKFLPEQVRDVYAISQTPQVVLDYQATDFNGELLINWDYVIEAFDEPLILEMFSKNSLLLRRLLCSEWTEVIRV